VCATGTFFNQLTNGKLSYQFVVIITCALSGVLAVNGVDDIIDYAVPFLSFIYPITLTLIIYTVVFGKRVQKKASFVAAILATSLVAILQLSIFIAEKVDKPIYAGKINKIIEILPLNDYELPWLIPSFSAFVAVYLFSKNKTKTKTSE
jgi:LIVCS family branched-chain amino acid:cation transporter